MIVAIHQPNYAPWLGYFYKIARADAFVFLDDVQYSKNGYTNRVQIDANGQARWLTVPVSYAFGCPIRAVALARAEWWRAHLDTLKTYYADAPCFRAVHGRIAEIYAALPGSDLAAANAALVRALAGELGLKAAFHASSAFPTGEATGDVRLARIAATLAPGATYLSGRGGAQYQSAETFAAHGIELLYSEFRPLPYPQTGAPFLPGLSVLDAVYRLGWAGTADFLAPAAAAA